MMADLLIQPAKEQTAVVAPAVLSNSEIMVFVRHTKRGIAIVYSWDTEPLSEVELIAHGRRYARFYDRQVTTERQAAVMVTKFLKDVPQ